MRNRHLKCCSFIKIATCRRISSGNYVRKWIRVLEVISIYFNHLRLDSAFCSMCNSRGSNSRCENLQDCTCSHWLQVYWVEHWLAFAGVDRKDIHLVRTFEVWLTFSTSFYHSVLLCTSAPADRGFWQFLVTSVTARGRFWLPANSQDLLQPVHGVAWWSGDFYLQSGLQKDTGSRSTCI